MKLFLAPMQGMTNSYYRNLYKQLFGGIDAFYAPFIATAHVRTGSQVLFKDIQPANHNGDINVVPQLLGKDGDDFRFFAAHIAKLGYEEINWNIGCPSSKVIRKNKGSGILSHPDIVRAFMDEVSKDKDYKLSVKMRLGMHDLSEGAKIVEILNDYPVSNVIIHARTGQQRYEGTVDLLGFQHLASLCKHQLTYNGDIFTIEDFKRIKAQLPDVDNFMLGRGALRDPFLPSQIKNESLILRDKNKLLKQFHDAMYDYFYERYPEGSSIGVMKEFWIYLGVNISKEINWQRKVMLSQNLDQYNKVVDEIFKTVQF